jgi:hypothetical protein
MSYVPPHLRKPELPKPVVVEDFPALGGGGPRTSHVSMEKGSFAEQALRWKEQREQEEYERRVKDEMEHIKREKKKRELFEESIMRSQLPHFRRQESTSYVRPVVVSAPETTEDSWSTVGDKKKQKYLEYLDRKERERLAKLNKEDFSEDSGSSQNNEEQEIWPAEDY